MATQRAVSEMFRINGPSGFAIRLSPQPPLLRMRRRLHCKNLTLFLDRNVVQVICFLCHISRGIDAGKLFEVVDEMRLIKIAAASRYIDPGKVFAGANLLQDLLKTPDAGKEFRRK